MMECMGRGGGPGGGLVGDWNRGRDLSMGLGCKSVVSDGYWVLGIGIGWYMPRRSKGEEGDVVEI